MRSTRSTSVVPALMGALLLLTTFAPGAWASPTGAWSAIPYPAPPSARALQVASDLGHRRLYRFGGSDGRAFTSDTWVLDLSGTGAWSRLLVTGDVPQAREHHSLVHDWARSRLLLFGGISSAGNVLDDVWALPLDGSPRWTRLEVPGVAPAPRYGHAAAMDAAGSRMIVSGGRGAAGARADAWALSLSPLTWAPVAPGTAGPEGRYRSALAYDGTHHVAWVYGGTDSLGRLLDDLWSFGPGDSAGCRPAVITGSAPSGLSGHSMSFDPGRSWLVLFGGVDAVGRSDRAYAVSTVELTSRLLSPAGTAPSARSGQAWVFDVRMDRHYLIGGSDGSPLDDVFWMDGDGHNWNPVVPAGTGPGPLAWHSAVLDDSLRRILVWGGLGPSGATAGLWQLSLVGDLPTWSQLATTGEAPGARYAHVAAFDPATRRMLVTGGTTGGTVSLGEAWSLDVDSLIWHRLPRPVPAPARRAAAGAWDGDRARLLLFGGRDSSSNVPRGDLWTLDPGPATWATAWPLPGQPPARAWHSLVLDPTADALVLFGGLGGAGSATPLGDLWRLDLAAGRWTSLVPAGTPPAARSGHSAVFDPAGARMIVFGGDTGGSRSAEAWSLSFSPDTAWAPLAMADGPRARSRHGAALDPSAGRMIVLGGADGDTLRDDAWALDLSATPAWSAIVPAHSQPPRLFLPTATYDPLRQRFIVLGNALDPTSRAWVMPLDGAPEWRPLVAEGDPPPPRWGASAVYDPVRDRILYFGGTYWITATPLDDLWALNLSPTPRWELLEPPGPKPSPRMGHAMTYDPLRDRMILHSGGNEPGDFIALGDQWALEMRDSLRWVELFTDDGSYLYRQYHTITYDPVRDRLLAFGGCEELTYGSVYQFTLGDTMRWTKLLWANAGGPSNRRGHTAVFDSLRDRIVVYGGSSERVWGPVGNISAEVWALELTDSCHWEPIAMAEGPAPVGRCEHSAYWDPVHHRMLVYGGNDGTQDLNDLWQATWEGEPPAAVDETPRPLDLAVRSVRPNPVAGRASIVLALPAAGPAGFDVFDIGGRRVEHRDLQLGAGTHVVELNARGSLRPGVYLLRIEQGGRSARARMVVIR